MGVELKELKDGRILLRGQNINTRIGTNLYQDMEDIRKMKSNDVYFNERIQSEVNYCVSVDIRTSSFLALERIFG